MSTIYYTPNGIPKQPGYNDPYNPYDTGRHGEQNGELGPANTESGWDYDLGRAKDGAVQQSNGEWVMPGGGGGGGGGGVGDLTASPYYQQYQSQIQAAQAADLSNTKSALQQLLIQFGLVPEGFQDKYGAIDDTIRQLIQKNTSTGVSQYARLMESKQDAQRAAIQNLARRGLTHSGAKGYALRRGSLDFNRAMSDSLGGVLGKANEIQGGYTSRELQRQQGLSQLLAQLAAQASAFSFRGGGSPAPAAVPQPSAPPVYQSAAGPSPYQPTSLGGVGGNQPGYYTGGALYATPAENPKINPIFYLK